MRNKRRDLDNSFSHSASRRKGRPGRVVSRSKNVARALNRPVNYTVPGIVPVLAQASSMACWATVFTMLESWRRQQRISIETAVGDVGQRWLDLYNANTGLSSANKVDFVTAAGLIAEPPTNFSVEGWENLLRSYGPIWVTTDEAPGLRWAIHARIITGISGDGTPQGTSFSIIDPAGGRQYREKISVFVPKYEEEVMRTGHTRIQVLHWDQDARSSTQSTTKSFARNVVPLSGAMQATVSAGGSAAPTDINALVQRLAGEGANEEELRSFLAELNASPATVSAQSGLAYPLGGGHVPITLPGTTLLGRYKAILFRASLTTALAAVPTGAPIAVLVNALPALANRYNVTIGLGPAVSGGVVAGAGFGVGIVFAPGNKIGIYGSVSGILGAIVSISATMQVTVIKGGPENFEGSAVLAGVSIDTGVGPTVAAHAILSPNGSGFLGVTGEVGVSLGLSPFEAFVQYQYTASTLSVANSAATRDFDIKLRIFIPAPAVDGPGINPMSGDGRGFHYSAGTSRAEIHATVRAGLTASARPSITIHQRRWGESKEYRQSDVTHPSGRPSWYKNLVGTPTPIRRATLPTSSSNLTINARNVSLSGTHAVKLQLHASGALPLIRLSPNIDADIQIYLAHAGSGQYKIDGSHDGFPAYELYIDRRLVYSHDPIARNQTPASLLPPSEWRSRSAWTAI